MSMAWQGTSCSQLYTANVVHLKYVFQRYKMCFVYTTKCVLYLLQNVFFSRIQNVFCILYRMCFVHCTKGVLYVVRDVFCIVYKMCFFKSTKWIEYKMDLVHHGRAWGVTCTLLHPQNPVCRPIYNLGPFLSMRYHPQQLILTGPLQQEVCVY